MVVKTEYKSKRGFRITNAQSNLKGEKNQTNKPWSIFFKERNRD